MCKLFRVMDDSSREKIVLRYTILELCEIDVRERIKRNLINYPVEYNLIKSFDSAILDVMKYVFDDRNSKCPRVVCNVGNKNDIKNINYSLINFAIWLQTYILKNKSINSAELIVVPSFNEGKCNIVKYKGFKINPIVEILIKCAFSFGESEHLKKLSLANIVNSFVGSAYDSLRDENSKEFSECIEGAIIAHSDIASALSFYNDSGNIDNWMALRSTTFLGRSYFVTADVKMTH
ncbi:hypothetical protein AT251_16815 [Enterovibrio nigricans]|nr:hypothetical protein AT251_16815 [Enterovibrio nigricans]